VPGARSRAQASARGGTDSLAARDPGWDAGSATATGSDS
jgi:hypothetical protein